MHPVLLKIGPLRIAAYGTMLAVAFGVGIWLARREARRLKMDPERVTDLGLVVLVCSVVLARLVYVALHWHYFAGHPGEIVQVWTGGLSFHGGLLGGVLGVGVYARLSKLGFWRLGEVCTPSIPLGYAITRMGCFLNGCCYGAPTSLPWALRFHLAPDRPELTVPSHPAQLYASALSLVLFAALMRLRRRPHADGQLFAWYLMGYGLVRIVVEYFRRGVTAQVVWAGVTQAQLASVFLIVAGVLLSVWLGRGKKAKGK
jgi:phosphatidylglycerol:prolipoprotein diacylglycerol transferase